MRRTKAALIYKATGNLRAVQILLDHTDIENTVRYLGVDVDDALTLLNGRKFDISSGFPRSPGSRFCLMNDWQVSEGCLDTMKDRYVGDNGHHRVSFRMSPFHRSSTGTRQSRLSYLLPSGEPEDHYI